MMTDEERKAFADDCARTMELRNIEMADWAFVVELAQSCQSALAEVEGLRTIMTVNGSWPLDDLRRAFVAGVAWWEFTRTGATLWGEDRREAEAEAARVYEIGRASVNGV